MSKICIVCSAIITPADDCPGEWLDAVGDFGTDTHAHDPAIFVGML